MQSVLHRKYLLKSSFHLELKYLLASFFPCKKGRRQVWRGKWYIWRIFSSAIDTRQNTSIMLIKIRIYIYIHIYMHSVSHLIYMFPLKPWGWHYSLIFLGDKHWFSRSTWTSQLASQQQTLKHCSCLKQKSEQFPSYTEQVHSHQPTYLTHSSENGGTQDWGGRLRPMGGNRTRQGPRCAHTGCPYPYARENHVRGNICTHRSQQRQR